MLKKIFGSRKTKSSSIGNHVQPKSCSHNCPVNEERSSSALKIIYAGGVIEYYYMAVPAARIIENNPSFILARPEVFSKPWDAVVRPEEMLIPGQKYFIVPLSTMKKLRSRTRKNHYGFMGVTSIIKSSANASSYEIVSQEKDNVLNSVKASNIISESGGKFKRRVRFLGTDNKDGSDSVSSKIDVHVKGSNADYPNPKNVRARDALTWEPSLTSIDENYMTIEP